MINAPQSLHKINYMHWCASHKMEIKVYACMYVKQKYIRYDMHILT